MRGWNDLGVVDTIYEEEQEEEEGKEEDASNSLSLSPSLSTIPSPTHSSSPPPPSLKSRVEAWSQATGQKPDVVVHVQDQCFHLHRDLAMDGKSIKPYIPNRCDKAFLYAYYGTSHGVGMHTGEEWHELQLSDKQLRNNGSVRAHTTVGSCSTKIQRIFVMDHDPLQFRSGYLRRHLTESSDITVSLPLNITAETFTDIACFCYGSDVPLTPFNAAALRVAAELLEMTEDDGAGCGNLLRRTEAYFRETVAVNAEHAAIVLRTCMLLLPEAAEIAASLAGWCVETLALDDSADEGWLDDVASFAPEEFRMIADSIRSRSTYNHDLLYRIIDHYLENHTGKIAEEEKHRICYTVDCNKLSNRLLIHLVQNPRMPLRFVVQAMLIEQLHTRRSIFDRAAPLKPRPTAAIAGGGNLTLGTILHRDAVLRQAAQLRASMEATNSRIESLERDLASMKRRLRRSGEHKEELDSVRSASFRFYGQEERREGGAGDGPAVDTSEKSCSGDSRSGRSIGRRLVHGLKSMFRSSAVKSTDGDGELAVELEEERRPTHRRNRSLA